MIEIAQLDAVREQHAIPQPVETIGEQNLALRTRRHTLQLGGAQHSIADAQVELVGVRLGECVRLPESHRAILPDATPPLGIREDFGRLR